MNRKIIPPAIVLLVLVAVFFVLKNRDASEKLSPIFSADSTAIAKIELVDPSDTLIVARQDDKWRLMHPVNWEVNQQTLDRLFSNVIKAKFAKTVMTTSPDAIKRYRLEPTSALQIKTYTKNGKLSDHVYFGNIGNPYDYFRYEGSSDIYQMKSLVTNTFRAAPDQWRSPVVLRISESEIKSIEVQYSAGSHVLNHKGKEWFFKDAANDFKIPMENRAILRTINILNLLDTYVFYDDPAPEMSAAFQKPYATVKINLTNGKSRKMVFAETKDKLFLLMLDDNPKTLYAVVKDSVNRFAVNSEHYRQLPAGIAPPRP